jgi:hypothetical protein
MVIVAMMRPREGMSNLVKQRVPNLLCGVQNHEVNTQLDAAGPCASGVEADAGAAKVLVETEQPGREAVLGHEAQCKGTRPLALSAQLVHATPPKKEVAR